MFSGRLSMLGAFALVALAMLQAAPSGVDWHRLIEASAKAITARPGPIEGEPLGRFDTPVGEGRAFRTDFLQGPFRRRYVVLIEPKDAAGEPVTIMVTQDANVDQMARSNGGPSPVFVDAYTCNSHATMAMLAHEPSFAELRSLIGERLQKPASGSSQRFTGACGFGAALLPGLGPAR
jgi:hypothetical protein